MSLAINVDKVDSVMLSDGAWYQVEKLEADTSSFDLDAYEFVAPNMDQALHGGGANGVCATGFRFKNAHTGKMIAGPLTAIVAVQYQE